MLQGGSEMDGTLSKAPQRPFRLRLWWLCMLLAVVAAPVTEAAEPGPLRFVFLVDTSAAMSGHKLAVIDILNSRISSGFDGQIRAGEAFALWTYAETVATNRYLP